MTVDKDIKRMFEAQRKIDEAMAPAFDALVEELEVGGKVVPISTGHKLAGLRVPTVTLTAIVLVAVMGLAAWIKSQERGEHDAALASPSDMQELNRICDSLLVRIEQLNPEVVTDFGTLEEEMNWHTGTDSLITVATF